MTGERVLRENGDNDPTSSEVSALRAQQLEMHVSLRERVSILESDIKRLATRELVEQVRTLIEKTKLSVLLKVISIAASAVGLVVAIDRFF